MDFAPLLLALQSDDNTVRPQAEAALQQQLQGNPSGTLQALVQAARSGADVAVSTMALILLRRLCDPKGDVWKALSGPQQQAVRQEVFASLGAIAEPALRRKVAHVLARMSPAWPELLQQVVQLAQSSDAAAQQTALFLLSKMSEFSGETMVGHAAPLMEMYGQALGAQGQLPTQLLGLQAAAGLLQCLEPAENYLQFRPIVPAMLEVIGSALSAGEELEACEGLEALIELARSCPTFLRDCLDQLASSMMQVAAADSLEGSTRHLSVELLVTVSEAAPAMVRQHQQLVQGIIQLSLQLCADADEEDAEWAVGEYSHQYNIEDESCEIGQEALERLGCCLGGSSVMPTAYQLLPAMLQSPDAKQRRAALAGLGHLAEGCSHELKEQLGSLIPIVVGALSDPSQRCRYDACQCLGRLIDTQEGLVQEEYHSLVVPAIVQALSMQAGNCARVYGHLCATTITYCNTDQCESDAMAPYAGDLLRALYELLQQAPMRVQEQAVTATATVAQLLAAEFAPFYDSFMPSLKALVLGPQTEETGTLRCRAIECFGLVGESSPGPVFVNDAMQIAQHLLANTADGTDPTYVLPALGRMAPCVIDAAPQLVEAVVQLVLATASMEVAMEMTEAEEGEKGDANSMVFSIAGRGLQRVSVNAEAMHAKMVACRTVFAMADSLEGRFFPFVDASVRALIPLTCYKEAQNVRSTSVLALPKLLYCTLKHAEETQASGDYSQGLLHAAVAAVMTVMPGEGIAEARVCQAEGLKELLRMMYESHLLTLGGEHVPALVEFMCARMGESLHRRALRTAEASRMEDFDAEAAEELEAEMEGEDELMTSMVDGVGYLIKKFGAQMLPLFDQHVAPLLRPMLSAEAPDSVRINAVCSFDDVIEHCGADARAHAAGALATFFEAAETSDNAVLRQCAVYGLTKVAACHPDILERHAQRALQLLASIIQDPEAKSEDNIDLSENAVSALGAIIKHVPGVDQQGLLPVWVAQLPLTSDESEAQYNHEMLCDLVEAQNPAVLAAADVALRVFGSILAQDPEDEELVQMASPETRARVPALVRALPQEATQAAFGTLEAPLQAALQAV